MQRILFAAILFILLTQTLKSQEITLDVNISTPQLTTVDPQIFEQLENSIEGLFQNTRWTDVDYQPEERIEASMQINIKTDNQRNEFKADIQIQTTRPVFGSTYKTPVISFVDKDINFRFDPFQPLQRSTNNYVNQLSSLMSYYAYIFLAYDYDTFEKQGGSEYLTLAQEVANSIPNSTASAMGGWPIGGSSNQARTRYALLENMINSRMVSFREGLYMYHRQGLDLMHRNPTEARKNIMNALKQIEDANNQYFNSLVVQMFCNAKRRELIEIFKGAGRQERLQSHEVLTNIDAGNASDYKELGS
ncbi:MAG: DUF4835 family protein [Bacteroidetes bacterium]|jgi:hypothetical protein|nr:DUF4835 family protein [Bacteroidota bacterium]